MLRVGLFLLAAAPLAHLSEATCSGSPEKWPVDAWKPRAAFEASMAGKPEVTVPPIGKGFNRTLNIDGFCNNVLMTSEVFKCGENQAERGEFFASVAHPTSAPTGSFLRFDNVNCPLSAVSIRRNAPGSLFEADIRFEFEACSAEHGYAKSPVSSAAVVMPMRKEAGRHANLLPWMKEVCLVATTTPAAETVEVKTETKLVEAGKGECQAVGPTKDYPTAKTAAACKAECMEDILEADATGKTGDFVCSAYAFDSKTSTCRTYGGTVDKIAKADADWECWLMSLNKKQNYNKNTQAPPPIQATQNLMLRQVMAGAPTSMTTAKVLQVSPQKGEEGCFSSSWWFTLADDKGVPASFPVMEAEWDELMTMVPAALPPQKEGKSILTVDRVLVKTCNPHAAGWGRECIMPKLKTVCDNKQLINSIIVGIVVPVFGSIIVRMIFKSMKPRDSYDSMSINADDSDFHRGTFQGFICSCIVALLCCGLVAAATSFLSSLAFGAAGCHHGEREMVVIAVATGVPAALSIIIGLMYYYLSGQRHANDKSKSTGGHYQTPPGHKLMLIEMQDGNPHGVPINPDVMMTGNTAMSSYSSQHMPQAIHVPSGEGTSHAAFATGH